MQREYGRRLAEEMNARVYEKRLVEAGRNGVVRRIISGCGKKSQIGGLGTSKTHRYVSWRSIDLESPR